MGPPHRLVPLLGHPRSQPPFLCWILLVPQESTQGSFLWEALPASSWP